MVGSNAKARISKHTCAYQGIRNVCFSESLVCFVFFCNTCFKIRLFPLLLMKCACEIRSSLFFFTVLVQRNCTKCQENTPGRVRHKCFYASFKGYRQILSLLLSEVKGSNKLLSPEIIRKKKWFSADSMENRS